MHIMHRITGVLSSVVAFPAQAAVLTLKSVAHMIEAIGRASNR